MRDIKKIISEMTLEEKAGLCSGKDFWHLKGVERLEIPEIMVTDGPHGLRKQSEGADHLGINKSVEAVCFPAACATAASFDETLLETMGETLGMECRAEHVAILLGPAVNIKRSPLCGRNFEYFSEDPYLTGKLAAAQIRGVQSADVGTSMKHFAANNQESARMTVSAEIDERTLREIYLTGFEIAVKESAPWTLMCAYNRVNEVYCSENKKLLTDILRKEWGFDGFVMSDWGAVDNHVNGVDAGLELQMPGSGPNPDQELVQAVKTGKMDEKILNRAVERILEKIFKYSDSKKEDGIFDREKDHALAVNIAKECAVLLKNEGVLPLKQEQKVVYIGDFAENPRFQGGGSSHILAHHVGSATTCAKEKERNVIYLPGFLENATEEEYLKAKKEAQAADAVVIFAGLPDSFESEGYDRENMRLPDCQNRLIQYISDVQANTIVVLHNGSPVEMPWAEDVNAVLEMYLGGEGVGEATDALLYGEANPCGRLPESFPYHLEDNPSYLNFPGDNGKVHYAEGVYVGYRYYEKKKQNVRWPFGHGLSYTEFEYGNMQLSADKMKESDIICVTVDVTNTGNCAGKEVIQLYVADRTGTKGRPEKELKGFSKVELEPGETKTAVMELNTRSLSWYCETLSDFYAASGIYEILLGHSSADIRAQKKLEYTSSTELPLSIDRNTPVGLLLHEPIIAEMLKQIQMQMAPAGTADGALNDGLLERMMVDMPLRALSSFGNITSEQLEEMIEKMEG